MRNVLTIFSYVNSTKNASIIFSIVKSFDGIFSLMYNKMPLPFLSRSRRKGLLKPFMKNYPIGKLASSFFP